MLDLDVTTWKKNLFHHYEALLLQATICILF